MKWLDKGIASVIKRFEYEYYLVNLDKNVSCVCMDTNSKQADLSCKRCLGTGHKIKIRKAIGVSRDSKTTFKNFGTDENTLANVYYQHKKYKVEEEDLLVDNGVMMVVSRIQIHKGSERDEVYNTLACVPIRSKPQERLSNFMDIIQRSSK